MQDLDDSFRAGLNVMAQRLWDGHQELVHRARSLLEVCEVFCAGVDPGMSAEELLRQHFPLATPSALAALAATFARAPPA